MDVIDAKLNVLTRARSTAFSIVSIGFELGERVLIPALSPPPQPKRGDPSSRPLWALDLRQLHRLPPRPSSRASR